MKRSYAVLWQQTGRAAVPGRLALLPLGFRFTPADESAGEEEMHYEDVAALRMGSAPDDELEGQPTSSSSVELGHPSASPTSHSPLIRSRTDPASVFPQSSSEPLAAA
jgi:hypothetical protein